MIIEFIGAYCHYTPSQSMDTTSLSPTEWESNNVEVARDLTDEYTTEIQKSSSVRIPFQPQHCWIPIQWDLNL